MFTDIEMRSILLTQLGLNGFNHKDNLSIAKEMAKLTASIVKASK